MGNLADLVRLRAVDRRDLRRAPPRQLRHRRRLGRGPDPAARRRRPPDPRARAARPDPHRPARAPSARGRFAAPERRRVRGALRRLRARDLGRCRRAGRPAGLRAGRRATRRVRGHRGALTVAEPAAPAFATLRYEVADAIATITLDRPEALNALTVASKQELLAAFERVASDRSVRAVVLTGAGRAFCSGQDLKERLEPDAAPLDVELRERYNPIIRAMRALDRPIVGAINGIAAGAGASLAFACDLRIAAEGASFLLAFGRVGLIPDSGATWLLPRLVGPAKAAEMALLTEPLTAADAERFGLVMRVVPGGSIDGRGAGGSRSAGRARPAGCGAHQAGARGAGTARSRMRSNSRPLQGEAGSTADHAEGIAAQTAASVHRGVNAPACCRLGRDEAVPIRGRRGDSPIRRQVRPGGRLAADPRRVRRGGAWASWQRPGRRTRRVPGQPVTGQCDADRASVKEGGEGHVDGFLVSIQLSVNVDRSQRRSRSSVQATRPSRGCT